jgi:CheY-like chemotaxis protein
MLARKGREALRAFERESFDVLLMDVQMPEMDGLEATVAIRTQKAGSGNHLPIVALTAHAMKEIVRNAWRRAWTANFANRSGPRNSMKCWRSP